MASERVTIPCPACMHDTTMRSRLLGTEAVHDDLALMFWQRPFGGPRGQQCTRWDAGWWKCRLCNLRLVPQEAGVLLDAVLMCHDPHCDSIRGGLHGDTWRALAGGKRHGE
jgi:hypothetical protein